MKKVCCHSLQWRCAAAHRRKDVRRNRRNRQEYILQVLSDEEIKAPKTEDMRVRRTIEAIKRSFEEMICEMDYEKIRVTELCRRAMINKKGLPMRRSPVQAASPATISEAVWQYRDRQHRRSAPIHSSLSVTGLTGWGSDIQKQPLTF